VPPPFIHLEPESGAEMIRSPLLDRRKVEFSGLMSRRRAGCAGGSYEGSRGLVADRPMRPDLVVVLAPILQLFAGVGKGQEPVSVQALGSQTAVEGNRTRRSPKPLFGQELPIVDHRWKM
jgi:hypothetical protein